MKLPLLLALTILLPTTAVSQQVHHDHESAYAGEEARSIKSLSDDDISELSQGGGWGLAKAAELNGMPGPSHILKMERELALTADQQARVRNVFQGMQREAVAEGARYISLEEDLEARFRERDVSETELKAALTKIEESRARLRFVHLSAHLALLDVLTKPQIDTYNRLRGYKVPG
jgi:Spy/CpxP family protein refolding chaperone